jgi:NADH:ubiquinone oxidoreductase subunit 2 (subunit N)
MIATYGMRLSPSWILLMTGASNMTYFAIEMSYIFTGSLDLSAGSDDFGPVEIELSFTIVFILMGLFGSNGITNSIT